jgi:hypothetical protein
MMHSLPMIFRVCTLLLEYILLIQNWYDCIRDNIFWKMSAIRCTEFCRNLFKSKYKLADTRNCPMSGRLQHSNVRYHKRSSFANTGKGTRVIYESFRSYYLKVVFKASVTSQKTPSPKANNYWPKIKEGYTNWTVTIARIVTLDADDVALK